MVSLVFSWTYVWTSEHLKIIHFETHLLKACILLPFTPFACPLMLDRQRNGSNMEFRLQETYHE